jgi:hypothetical protein
MSVNLSRLNFVGVAPDPIFTRLDRADERMVCAAEMLGSVFVFRRIAATDVRALKAEPQMDPSISRLDAVFTYVFVGRGELDAVQVCTVGQADLPRSGIR